MRCPVCRAEVMQGPQCRRCRADLTLLLALEEQRRQALAAAARALSEGNTAEALCQAERAHGVRPDPEAQRLLAVVHLLRRDFARAWEHYTTPPFTTMP